MIIAEEIERKFLVELSAVPLEQGTRLVQGYIPTRGKQTVRLRIAGAQAWLTLKGPNTGARRLEFEYPIPVSDAETMLAELCEGEVIDKTRYEIPFAKHLWEVDVFHGANEGLVVAEVELTREDEQVELPPWVTKEVTGDARYYNVNLLACPFSQW